MNNNFSASSNSQTNFKNQLHKMRWSIVAALLVLTAVHAVSAVRYAVGDKGWSPSSSNLTLWAQGKHFYNGDWLFFVFDRNQQNVLEVRNKTEFDNCISDHPLHNWTRGAGRDVVPLNITKTYYFISGNGFCFSGVKVEIHVENPPPPPRASPIRSSSPSLMSSFRGQIVLPALFAVATMWDSILLRL